MAYRLVNKIQQFNFQINRVLTYGEMAGHETEIIQATKGIKTLDDWFDAWVCLGPEFYSYERGKPCGPLQSQGFGGI